MRFIDAMAALLAGEVVRRPSWSPRLHIRRDSDNIIVVKDGSDMSYWNKIEVLLGGEAIAASDWEIYEVTVKEK